MTEPLDSDAFRPFAARMAAAQLPPVFVASFARYYDLLRLGHTGLVPEADITPVADLPDAAALAPEMGEVGRAVLSRVVMIKLNGGLGTSMGLQCAKSLLVVKDGLTFLDVIARQAIDAGVPLVLMNSFATETDALSALARYPDLAGSVAPSFLQHKEPKIVRADLSPAIWPANPDLEWCPPGHGDLYAALLTSGTLQALLHAGRDYAFVSNADNLGASIDPHILGHFHTNRTPFLMEVADRTEMDRKGGHLARASDGRLVLRESAQCPPADQGAFQDVERHRYFNTNNLWINLRVLAEVLEARDHHLGLPLICNAKTVDPRDPLSTPVWQLETAMGAAIGVFPDACALRVPRERFAPVKTTEDLLAVRSDAYVLTADQRIVPSPLRRAGPLRVDLDPTHYRFVTDLDERFPHGAPSLVECRECRIVGDFRFGRDVRFSGSVSLVNLSGEAVAIPDGAMLRGEVRYGADA
jgi:UTP--glucose-1-phosphate uridylyltransferase